jgi:hypothetical protein
LLAINSWKFSDNFGKMSIGSAKSHGSGSATGFAGGAVSDVEDAAVASGALLVAACDGAAAC